MMHAALTVTIFYRTLVTRDGGTFISYVLVTLMMLLQGSEELFGDNDFQWRVPKCGYEWVNAHVTREGTFSQTASPLLTEIEPRVPGPEAYRDYAPLRTAELFKRLAEVQETQDGIRGFANQFGLLGDTRLASRDRSAKMSALITGEDIDLWSGSIQRMKQALQLWEGIRDEDTQELDRLLRKFGLPHGPGPMVRKTPFHYGSAPGVPGMTRNARIDTRDPLTAARLLLGVWMGHSLQRQVSPRPLWNPQEERYVIRILPLTLQGAIWWQFARAVAGEIQFRPCKVCGGLMEIAVGGAGGGRRSHAQFCSGKCRQKDQREKVKRAQEMKARRKTDREIARHFKTGIDSIKRWLRPRERSKGKAS
jgi:hypothetical protein